MANLDRQGFTDYCLRKLGAPILNIEVTDAQLDDAITDAVNFYWENHYDGIERSYQVHTVTGTTITVSDTTGIKKGDTISRLDGSCMALIASVQGSDIIINHQLGMQKFFVGDLVAASSNKTNTLTISNIVLGDVDLGYFQTDSDVVGVTNLLQVTSVMGSSDYMFNMQYQIMMTEIQALTKAGASMYWQTLNYLGHLDFILKKSMNYVFNRRKGRLELEISWSTDVVVGSVIAAEVYRIVDPEVFNMVYEDRWLKRYATALIKKQWGNNLGMKYSGVQMPGGITFNGMDIYNSAVTEIEALETEAIENSAPLSFIVG